MTSELDVVKYLTDKGIQTWRAGGDEVSAHCIWGCDGSAARGKGKWYVNTGTWLGWCMVCGTASNRKILLDHFGDEDEIQSPQASDLGLRRRILHESAEMAHEMLLGNEKQLDYLLSRGIDAELIVSMKLGYVPRNFGLSDSLPCRKDLKGYEALIGAGIVTISGREFFNGSLTIPYFSHGQVVQIRAKDPDGKYKTTANDTARLYNYDALFGAEDVLITEGEYDSLAVRSAVETSGERSLTGLAVIGVPGAGSWPEGLQQTLAQARRIFIGFDPDDTGRKFAIKLKEALGARARIIKLPVEGQDWSDWLKTGKGWRDVQQLLIEADLAGKQMFSMADLAAKWTRQQTEAPGMKLGWPQLDAILRPGLKPGQVLVPLAATGTGKTILLSNVAYNCRNEGVLYCSLELSGAELFEQFRRLHRFHYPTAAQDQAVVDLAKIATVERNRLGEGDIEALIEEYADTLGQKPRVVIIDYLQYYARGFPGSMYERTTDAIMETKAVAKGQGVSVIVPSQVNRGAERGKPLELSAARESGGIEETADFVLSLFRPDQANDADQAVDSGAFNMQLLKSRHGGVGRTFNMQFSPMSLVITDKVFDRPGTARAQQEGSLARQGTNYIDLRKQQDDSIAQAVLAI